MAAAAWRRTAGSTFASPTPNIRGGRFPGTSSRGRLCRKSWARTRGAMAPCRGAAPSPARPRTSS
jgi:hypothetical protein